MRIGYLGRIHPRKRVERIFYALDALQDKNLEILVIGDGDAAYIQFLREEAKRLHLDRMIFTGFLSGEEKEKALKSLSYLVVPSDFSASEVFKASLIVAAKVSTSLSTHQPQRCVFSSSQGVPLEAITGMPFTNASVTIFPKFSKSLGTTK